MHCSVAELVVEDREAIGHEVADHHVASRRHRSWPGAKGSAKVSLATGQLHLASKTKWQRSTICWGFWTWKGAVWVGSGYLQEVIKTAGADLVMPLVDERSQEDGQIYIIEKDTMSNY